MFYQAPARISLADFSEWSYKISKRYFHKNVSMEAMGGPCLRPCKNPNELYRLPLNISFYWPTLLLYKGWIDDEDNNIKEKKITNKSAPLVYRAYWKKSPIIYSLIIACIHYSDIYFSKKKNKSRNLHIWIFTG